MNNEKKTIVITSGGTIEPIDAVRAIRNSSSGKLGALIAEELKKAIPSANIYYLSNRYAVRPGVEHHWIETTSVLDVKSKIETLLTEKKVDIFIHSMAVADYTVEKIKSVEGEFKPSFITKLSSEHEQLSITLKKSPKLISLIKKLQPHVFLVGFKLLSHVTEEKLFDVGFNLLRKNRCNLVLANDLSSIKQGNHEGLLIYPEKKYEKIRGKKAIAEVLASVIVNRAFCKHSRSIKVSEDVKISNEILNEMRTVGELLYKEGALPDVENGTYGNMSIKQGKEFFITGRNVHKGKLTSDMVCRIENCIPIKDQKSVYTHVLYHGKVKPSIDSAIHQGIYEKNDEIKSILHVHTEEIFNHPITSYNYPCGTMEERDAILSIVHPGKDIIQMKKHGVIIMGDSLTNCYFKWKQLQSDFYLSPLNTDEYIWKEWLEHVEDVGGFPEQFKEKMMNIENYWNIKKDNHCYGLCYINAVKDKNILTFVIYISKKYQKKGLGIGEKVLSILEKVAKSEVLDLQLITKPLCGVENYYLKMGFHIHEKNDYIILMRKNLKDR